MSKLSDRVRQVRNTLGMSQKEFANKLGIGWQTLVRYEKGERDIPSSVIESIIRLGISPTWLFTGEGDMFIKDQSVQKSDMREKDIAEITSLLKEMPELAPFVKRLLESHKATLDTLEEIKKQLRQSLETTNPKPNPENA